MYSLLNLVPFKYDTLCTPYPSYLMHKKNHCIPYLNSYPRVTVLFVLRISGTLYSETLLYFVPKSVPPSRGTLPVPVRVQRVRDHGSRTAVLVSGSLRSRSNGTMKYCNLRSHNLVVIQYQLFYKLRHLSFLSTVKKSFYISQIKINSYGFAL